MLDKTLSKNKPKNYKFVIITLDSHSAGPVARVQAKLNKKAVGPEDITRI